MATRSLCVGILVVVLTACAPGSGAGAPSPAATFVTATLPASPMASGVPQAATAGLTGTSTPLSGTTTTQVNVRQQPMASARVLGTLTASAPVEVFSRDPGGNWFEIAYAAGDAGRGWVAAQYVSVPDAGAVPTSSGGGEPSASVREQINVRSGPGTQFDAVGLLSAGDVVRLTGKDRTGTWVQIRFAKGADGLGWVATAFLTPAAIDGLPSLTAAVEPVGTSTPVSTAPTITPPPMTAQEDNDSAAKPAFEARFSPGGAGSVFYTSQLSAPAGDESDWIQFTPYYDSMRLRLDCEGDSKVSTEITKQGVSVPGIPLIECGTNTVLALKAGDTYMLHVSVSADGAEQAYLSYTVSLFAAPAN